MAIVVDESATLLGRAVADKPGTPPPWMRHALICSVVLHSTLIALAVGGTAHPRAPREVGEARERVNEVRLPRAVHSPAAEPPRPASRPTARGFRVVVAPVDVPTTIPDVNLTRMATVEAEFTGKGIVKSIDFGPTATMGSSASLEPFDETDVDVRAFILSGQMGPAYPDRLRGGAPDGTVTVGFVLDTAGHLEPRSLRVVRASHPLFVEAVLGALERLRFSPAEVDGRRVRVRMEQRFEFHLAR